MTAEHRARTGGGMAALSGIVALSAFDRLSVAPLLVPIAHGLNTTQSAITLVATVSFVTYGASQVGHGWLSDRIGRTRALRIALAVMGAANILAAAAPSAAVLLAARSIDGAASGGLVPGALVLLADQNLGARAARRQAALVAALGAGTAITAAAGLADGPDGWRAVFAITALACLALIRPLPASGATHVRIAQRPAIHSILAQPQVRFISLVAIPEGAAVFGFVVFFAPVLQHVGWTTQIAALSTGAVGIGMLLGGILVRPLTGQVRDAHLLLGGAAIMTTGYLLATGHAIAPVMIAAALTGIGQSAVHTTLQRWSTLAVPQARGVSTALFATGAFGGAALATLLGTALPDQFTALFLTGAACTVASGVLAARHRALALQPRWQGRSWRSQSQVSRTVSVSGRRELAGRARHGPVVARNAIPGKTAKKTVRGVRSRGCASTDIGVTPAPHDVVAPDDQSTVTNCTVRSHNATKLDAGKRTSRY